MAWRLHLADLNSFILGSWCCTLLCTDLIIRLATCMLRILKFQTVILVNVHVSFANWSASLLEKWDVCRCETPNSLQLIAFWKPASTFYLVNWLQNAQDIWYRSRNCIYCNLLKHCGFAHIVICTCIHRCLYMHTESSVIVIAVVTQQQQQQHSCSGHSSMLCLLFIHRKRASGSCELSGLDFSCLIPEPGFWHLFHVL